MEEEILMRAPTLARYLGLSTNTVYKYAIELPDFPRPVRMGNRMLFRRVDVDAWLKRITANG